MLVFPAMLWGWLLWAAFWHAPVNRVAEPGRTLEQANQPQLVTLAGNVHPLARGEFDEGVVEPDTPLDRMALLLKSSPERQTDLDALVEAQHDAHSPVFHQWLTPAEGRLATVAKGARRHKSPFLGKLDLFYQAEFSFARSRRSGLHTLREVRLLETREALR